MALLEIRCTCPEFSKDSLQKKHEQQSRSQNSKRQTLFDNNLGKQDVRRGTGWSVGHTNRKKKLTLMIRFDFRNEIGKWAAFIHFGFCCFLFLLQLSLFAVHRKSSHRTRWWNVHHFHQYYYYLLPLLSLLSIRCHAQRPFQHVCLFLSARRR